MKRIYKLENLCCANCANKIERTVAKAHGVAEATLSFMLQKLTVVSDVDLTDEIVKIVRKIEPDCKVTAL